MSGFSPSGRLAALTWFNEAVSGSLALRLTGSLHGASTRRLLPALSASLHAGRSVGMMNTFQFMSWFGGAGAPEDNEAILWVVKRFSWELLARFRAWIFVQKVQNPGAMLLLVSSVEFAVVGFFVSEHFEEDFE